MGQKVKPIGLRVGINRTWDLAGMPIATMVICCIKILNCVPSDGTPQASRD